MKPWLSALALLLALGGCVMRPEGEQDERDRAAAAGAFYRQPFAERELPPLTTDASLSVLLAHAERANGELEASWQQWLMALERVPQASTQRSTAMVGIEHTLDGGAALDRTVFQLMSDTMNNIMWPGRMADEGRAALAAARTAAAAFDRQRLQLQAEVAAGYHELALRDEEIRIQERLRAVLAVQVPSLAARVRAGSGSQRELLAAQIALDRVDAELAALRLGRPALQAALLARIGARPDAVELRPPLAALQPLQPGEQEFVLGALEQNPMLRERTAEVAAGEADVVAATWERVPMFSLRGEIMGDGAQLIGGAFTLPWLRGTAIEAAIREAEAAAAAAGARRRQAAHDAGAAVTAELAGLDAAAAEAEVLRGRLLPKLQQSVVVARASWSAGGGDFAAVVEAQAMLLEVERQLARLAAAHSIGRARLQELVGGAPRD